MEFHPDRNQSPEASARFKEIGEAYSVLGDQAKRTTYDARQQASRHHHRAGFNPFNGSIFEDFFGGAHGRGMPWEEMLHQQEHRRQMRQSIRVSVDVTLEEVRKGVSKQFVFDGQQVSVQLPAGVEEGETLVARASGNLELHIRINITQHPIFRRVGADLYCTVDVPFVKALMGGDVRVKSLDGGMTLRIPPKTNSHAKLRVRDAGIPRNGITGSIFYEVKILLSEIDIIEQNLIAGILNHET